MGLRRAIRVGEPLTLDVDSRAGRWLRRADQAVVAGFVLAALVALAGYWFNHGGHRGQLIDIDRAPTLEAEYKIDLNRATWPELAQLPGIGETLGRRIVEVREAEGPFVDVWDLERVPGIGRRTVERLLPYLIPPRTGELAGP